MSGFFCSCLVFSKECGDFCVNIINKAIQMVSVLLLAEEEKSTVFYRIYSLAIEVRVAAVFEW